MTEQVKRVLIPVGMLTLVFASIPAQAETLSGQVFIVTGGHESIKLGLVEVGLFDLKDVVDSVAATTQRWKEERKAIEPLVKAAEELEATAERVRMNAPHGIAYDAARETWEKAMKLSSEVKGYARLLASSTLIFESLPPPILKTKTDADGNFALELPHGGSFAVGARSSRQVGEKKEYYDWMVKLEPRTSKIMLSNDNMTSSTGTESVFHAADANGWAGQGASSALFLQRLNEIRAEVASSEERDLKRRKQEARREGDARGAKTLRGDPAVIVITPVRVNIPEGEVIIPRGTRLRLISETPENFFVDYNGYSVPVARSFATR
jgi:hypothetical protein